jgi:hypothetical protein
MTQTQALQNFVARVANDQNQDARAALVGALGTNDAWVKDYVTQLTVDGSPALARLAAVGAASLDKLILALFGNAALKQELLTVLNQPNPPTWLTDVVGLLGQDGSVIDAYVKALTTDAADGTPGKLAAKLEGVAGQAGHQKDLDTLIKALAAQPYVRSELAQVLGQSGDWVATYLGTLADDQGTVSAAGQLLADKLDDTHVLTVKALDALLGALAAKANVRTEMVKVLGGTLATDDGWLDGYAAALTGTDAGARTKLAAHLGKVVHDDPPGKLKSLVDALAADADVLTGLGKTLGDKGHAVLLAKLIPLILGAAPTAKDVATFLSDRPELRTAAVSATTLQALLLVLEQADAPAKTADFAKIIKTYVIAKPLRQALGVPEPPPSQLVPPAGP